VGTQSAGGKQKDRLVQEQVIRESPQQRRKKSRHAFLRRWGEQQDRFVPDWLKQCVKKFLAVSVAASTTPQTPTENETTFNRDCIDQNACAGRRSAMVFVHCHEKWPKSLFI
jgi:hypothetical protein